MGLLNCNYLLSCNADRSYFVQLIIEAKRQKNKI